MQVDTRAGAQRRTSSWTTLARFAALTAVGALLVVSSLAVASGSPNEPSAGVPHGAPASSPSASGPLVDLGITFETGPALGGAVDPSTPVPLATVASVEVNLPLQNSSGLSEFVQSVSNPNSPDYAQFLTVPQFAARFAPSAGDVGIVTSYLQSYGLDVLSVSPNRLSLTVQGSLAQLGPALHVTFAMYSAAGAPFWAPTASPEVPASVAPWVFGIAGLTDHPSDVRVQATAPSTSGVAGIGTRDYPDAMHYEFQLNQLYNGTGAGSTVVPTYAQGVTVVQGLWSDSSVLCGYSTTDIGNFFNQSAGYPSGIPKPVMQPHYSVPGYAGGAPASGNCSTAGLNVSNAGTQEVNSATIELTLDQEYSGTDAPGATLAPTWVNGTGPAATNGALAALVNWITGGNLPGMDVLTQSFGGGESAATNGSFEATLEQDYLAAAATGVTVLASSGDSNGATGAYGNGNALCGGGPADEGVPGIDYPGSSPNVLSVGGTATFGSGTSILGGQTVWNWCPSADSGVSAGGTGGVSLAFPEAWYQKGIAPVDAAMDNAIQVTVTGNGSASSPLGINDGTVYNSTSARPDPDLAGPAANNSVFFADQWLTGYGGTSFSSPSVAGMLASIIAFDGHRLGPFGPALYSLEAQYLAGKLKLPPTYFVQNYSNAFFNGSPDYNTSAGWGVPLAYNIALDLGKPLLATTPHLAPAAGMPYKVSVHVHDVRVVTNVNVTYREPGSSVWTTTALSLAKGTAQEGTWSGSIPAPTSKGTLEYCVSAIDRDMGNSWTPYNQSAWAATRGTNLTFGCTTPFHVSVKHVAAPASGPVPSERAPGTASEVVSGAAGPIVPASVAPLARTADPAVVGAPTPLEVRRPAARSPGIPSSSGGTHAGAGSAAPTAGPADDSNPGSQLGRLTSYR
jgi:subtilase family serine protease